MSGERPVSDNEMTREHAVAQDATEDEATAHHPDASTEAPQQPTGSHLEGEPSGLPGSGGSNLHHQTETLPASGTFGASETPEPPEQQAPSPPAPAAPAAAEGASDEAQARRRPQLNPTVDEQSARPVPQYGSAAPQAEAPAADAAAPEADAPAPSATAVPPPGPVEIPRDASLDEDLEREIAAAMAGDEQQAATAAAAAAMPAAEEAAPQSAPAAAEGVSEERLRQGSRLRGKVQSLSGENVFFELGFRSPGVVPLRQFPQGKPPEVGQDYEVVVDHIDEEEGLVALNLPKGNRKVRGNWEELSAGQVVECLVTKTNKGGLEVAIGALRGFLPASQVDTRFVSDLEPFVGQKLQCQVVEVNPKKRNLVVSRRAILEQHQKEAGAQFWTEASPGQKRTGTVKTIKDYGVFVDLGGIDGFLHVGEISWARVKHPSELLREGQEIEVTILALDPEKQKISLGMRQLTQNPWAAAVENYAQGTRVSGKVTRTTEFGAFVELEPGVEGLIHISELEHRRVKRVTEVLNVGQQVETQVLEVDPNRRRISLSLKALVEKPAPPADEDLAPSAGAAYQRKRHEPLKGGKTPSPGRSTGGSGLFGNPDDFR